MDFYCLRLGGFREGFAGDDADAVMAETGFCEDDIINFVGALRDDFGICFGWGIWIVRAQ